MINVEFTRLSELDFKAASVMTQIPRAGDSVMIGMDEYEVHRVAWEIDAPKVCVVLS